MQDKIPKKPIVEKVPTASTDVISVPKKSSYFPTRKERKGT